MTFFRGSKIGFIGSPSASLVAKFPFTSDLVDLVSSQPATFWPDDYGAGSGTITYLNKDGYIVQGSKPLITPDGINLGGESSYAGGFSVSAQPYSTMTAVSATWLADDGQVMPSIGMTLPARKIQASASVNSGCYQTTPLTGIGSFSDYVTATLVFQSGGTSSYLRFNIAPGNVTTPAGAGYTIRTSDGAMMGQHVTTSGWIPRGVKIDRLANNYIRVRITMRTGGLSSFFSVRPQVWLTNNTTSYSSTAGSQIRIGYVSCCSHALAFHEAYKDRIPLTNAEVLNNNFITFPTSHWPDTNIAIYYETVVRSTTVFYSSQYANYGYSEIEMFGTYAGDNPSEGFNLGNYMRRYNDGSGDDVIGFSTQVLAADGANIANSTPPLLADGDVLKIMMSFDNSTNKIQLRVNANPVISSTSPRLNEGFSFDGITARAGFGGTFRNLKVFSGIPTFDEAEAA